MYDASCGRELLPVSHIIIIIMIVIIIIKIKLSIYKSGMMPPVEESYWLLPSGPTWLWWLLAILPLDSHAQVKTEQKQKTPMLDMC